MKNLFLNETVLACFASVSLGAIALIGDVLLDRNPRERLYSLGTAVITTQFFPRNTVLKTGSCVVTEPTGIALVCRSRGSFAYEAPVWIDRVVIINSKRIPIGPGQVISNCSWTIESRIFGLGGSPRNHVCIYSDAIGELRLGLTPEPILFYRISYLSFFKAA